MSWVAGLASDGSGRNKLQDSCSWTESSGSRGRPRVVRVGNSGVVYKGERSWAGLILKVANRVICCVELPLLGPDLRVNVGADVGSRLEV